MAVKWAVTAASAVAGGGLLAVFWARLPPVVPVWYSRPWGEDQLAKPVWLWAIPAIVVVLGVGGEAIRRLLKDTVAETLLVWAIAGAQIILTIGLARIIMLVV